MLIRKRLIVLLALFVIALALWFVTYKKWTTPVYARFNNTSVGIDLEYPTAWGVTPCDATVDCLVRFETGNVFVTASTTHSKVKAQFQAVEYAIRAGDKKGAYSEYTNPFGVRFSFFTAVGTSSPSKLNYFFDTPKERTIHIEGPASPEFTQMIDSISFE